MSKVSGDAEFERKSAVPPAAWRNHYALGVLTVIYMLNYFDRNIFSIVLPKIKESMEISDTALGLVGGPAFVLLYAVLGVPFAYLADRYSRRNIIAAGLAFWSCMTALTGMAANIWQLAAARILMGAGEATNVSPSNSMLGDLYPRERRSFALSVLNSGSTIGLLLGSIVAGWVAQTYGWREAFYVAGVPGVLIAILFFATVKEPARGAKEQKGVSITVSSFSDTMRFFASSRTYVLMLLGGCFMAVFIYAGSIWSPTFLARVHNLSPLEVGTWIGIVRGPFGLAGLLTGGFLAEWLGRKDPRWQCFVPAIGCILVAPAEILFLFAGSWPLAVAGMALASFFGAIHIGPFYAVLQSVVKVRMRAMAPATFLLCANLVGQIVGPLGVGYLNDELVSDFGQSAIRYSLMVSTAFAVAAGFIIFAAGYHIAKDSRRALEA